MSKADLHRVKQALLDAGVEIYRTNATDGEIQVAERVRLHIMDSGVRVRLDEVIRVRFTARSQKSDFPNESPDQLFTKVRSTVGPNAQARGYIELAATSVEVKDPVDQSKVLDVWHEVTYEKSAQDESEAVDEVRWALEIEKYVGSN